MNLAWRSPGFRLAAESGIQVRTATCLFRVSLLLNEPNTTFATTTKDHFPREVQRYILRQVRLDMTASQPRLGLGRRHCRAGHFHKPQTMEALGNMPPLRYTVPTGPPCKAISTYPG